MKNRPPASTPFLLIALLCFLFTGCGNENLSGAEEAAVQFYKSVWVEGNKDQAQRMMMQPNRTDELDARMEDLRLERTSNPALQKNPSILVVESPTDPQVGDKKILIHRPADKKDYKIWMRKEGWNWKVIKFQGNYDPHSGGYISNDAYQRLVHEFPGLRWKRVNRP
ncbi:hypothetical protein [Paludifilum halophilum]|uniref:DUF4878 domain-containing protein n=1 Tax=Paludifilum halophilum TaxID=1642702 RepID=A0A235BE83_9BACL|nr:hypothetical protein [Paludifilum halophilum]OYD09915.1 hypothetical protein CHM34_02770 [Paludifilum halophilum]